MAIDWFNGGGAAALVELPARAITELPQREAFRALSRAEQLDALAGASMDVLHALLEAPADLACARARASLFAIATFVLTSKELHALALCDIAKREALLKKREQTSRARASPWRLLSWSASAVRPRGAALSRSWAIWKSPCCPARFLL